MSGTSMDGLDCSLIETDGQEYTKIIKEKTYEYSCLYKKILKFTRSYRGINMVKESNLPIFFVLK